jgi:hypothetical protein
MSNEFTTTLATHLGNKQPANKDVAQYLELYGATIVEPTAFEPDPNTHRHEYYYNAVDNILYKRNKGTTGYYWHKVSQ